MPRRSRSYGDGSVYFDRQRRRWVASYQSGGRKRVRRFLATEGEAEDELVTLKRLYGSRGPVAAMTLSEYLDDWLASHGPSVRPSTAVSYRGHVDNHIGPRLGAVQVGRLTSADVRRLVREVGESHRPATVHRVYTTLNIALGQAAADGDIPRNPCDGVRLPRVQSAPVRAMTFEVRDSIIGAVEGTDIEAIVRLLLGSGMRLGEACGLDWGDVHEDERFVVVRRSKTRPRVVPVNDDAVAALRSLPRTGDGNPVFLGPRTGRRLAGMTVSHAFPRALEAAGLPRMRVHDLRHGVATMLLSRGVPMRVISEQLGHASPALTSRTYAHVAPEVWGRAIDRTEGEG